MRAIDASVSVTLLDSIGLEFPNSAIERFDSICLQLRAQSTIMRENGSVNQEDNDCMTGDDLVVRYAMQSSTDCTNSRRALG